MRSSTARILRRSVKCCLGIVKYSAEPDSVGCINRILHSGCTQTEHRLNQADALELRQEMGKEGCWKKRRLRQTERICRSLLNNRLRLRMFRDWTAVLEFLLFSMLFETESKEVGEMVLLLAHSRRGGTAERRERGHVKGERRHGRIRSVILPAWPEENHIFSARTIG